MADVQQGYCVKDKKKQDFASDPAPEVVPFGKKGRTALKGKCANCGTTMFKILPKS